MIWLRKAVEVHERAEAIAEPCLVVLFEVLEAVASGLQARLHAGVVSWLPPRRGQVEHLRERLDLAPVVDLHGVELVLELLELVRVGGRQQLRAVVVGGEGVADVVGVVHEVEDEGGLLAGL